MKKILIATVLIAVGMAVDAATTFSYQGVLLDQKGQPPAGGQAGLTFRVYDQPTGGTALWTSSKQSVAVGTNGLFSTEVDGGASLANALAAAALDATEKRLYLGVTVDGAVGEINPRQELGPVPLAAYAQDVRQVKGGFAVGGDLTLSGPVSVNTNKVFRPSSLESRGVLHATLGAMVKQGAFVNNGLTVSGSCMAKGVSMDVPPGTIVMWHGSAEKIPDGWLLCDTNKTVTAANGASVRVVDLRGRFVVGAGTSKYPLAKTGGAASVTLTTDQIPNHTHIYSYDDQLSKENGSWKQYANPVGQSHSGDWISSGGGTHGSVYESGVTGGSQAHENRPPFYSLCYIIKVN